MKIIASTFVLSWLGVAAMSQTPAPLPTAKLMVIGASMVGGLSPVRIQLAKVDPQKPSIMPDVWNFTIEIPKGSKQTILSAGCVKGKLQNAEDGNPDPKDTPTFKTIHCNYIGGHEGFYLYVNVSAPTPLKIADSDGNFVPQTVNVSK